MAQAALTVPVSFEVDEPLARVCIALVEMFLNQHPDYDLRVMQREDGTCRYSVVVMDEPCRN